MVTHTHHLGQKRVKRFFYFQKVGFWGVFSYTFICDGRGFFFFHIFSLFLPKVKYNPKMLSFFFKYWCQKQKRVEENFGGWWWSLLILLLGNNIFWLRKTFSTPGIGLVITFFLFRLFSSFLVQTTFLFLFTREFDFFHRVSHNNDFLLVHRVIHGNFGRHKIRCSSQN